MDVENADFFKTVEQLREVFGISVCPTCCPVMEGEKMVALIDFVERNMKVYKNGVPRDQAPAPRIWATRPTPCGT